MEALTTQIPRLAAARDRLRAPTAARVFNARGIAPVAALYALLVLALWLPFGPRNGMPYETTFAYNSETSSLWHGFFYSADPLRIYTDVFYNLGYHLSFWIGQGGSFIGYQIVYAALWWARGLLACLIMRMLFPRHPLLPALTGLLVLVQASDRALNWVGQLNQFGMIFWMLLAFYALIWALRTRSLASGSIATALALLFTYLSLWSYESPLFMILAFPVLALAVRFGWSKRNLAVCGAFYVVPLIYMWETYQRYAASGGSTYQESVARHSFAPGPVLSDLWFNLSAALRFPDWGAQMAPVSAGTERLLLSLGAAAAAAAAISAVGYGVLRRREELIPGARALLVTLTAGLTLLILSFPAYLVLASARTLWRTQFLAGIGAGVTLAAVSGLVALALRRRPLQLAVIAAAGAIVTYFGVYASFTAASFHYANWQRQRTAMAEILANAPNLRGGSLVVLTGVPKSADPFRDNMWFDMALRLAYPHDPVVGVYFFSDGSPAPHENMALHAGWWSDDGSGYSTIMQRVPFRNTVIIRYSPSGRGSLVADVPAFLYHRDPVIAADYRPRSRVVSRPVSVLVRRRYGPIPAS